MKRYKFIHLWLLVAMVLLTVSCTNDDIWESQETPVKGLVVGFDTGNEAFTRAEVTSDVTLNEATVDHADIFIFDGNTGTLIEKCHWHLTPADMEENQSRSKTLLDGDWKNTVLNSTDYDVYVIANIHSTSDLSSVSSVTDLQTLIEQDNEVYKVYNETEYPNKFFTMIGKVEGFNPQASEVGDEYILPVELKRLAAKIEINLSFSKDFAERYSSTNVEARLRNYGVNAPILEENDAVFDAERASMSGYESAYQYNHKENTAKLILYTYPTEWEADMLKETFVAVNIPVIDLNKPEGDPERFLNTNYYKISLRGTDNEKRLERNHLYRVDAVINMLGSYIPDEPMPLKEVKYAALDWENVPVNIDGGSPRYLVLSEEKIVMRDIALYDKLKFASSSEIVSATISNIYYIDKNGKKKDVDSRGINATYPSNKLNDYITINSPVPTNKTIRYMTLTVRNKQGEVRTVQIEQYPLVYITGIEGFHSYSKNFNSREYPQPCTYEYKGCRKVMWGSSYEWDDGGFQSKVYINGQLGTFEWKKNSSEPTFTYQSGWVQNNRMYHVVISSTSGDYTLARPLMSTKTYSDGAGVSKSYAITTEGSESDGLVSPSFMLASQLGAVWDMSWSDAQKHCAMYVEKGMNGKVYDDWRLPTAAELKIIALYQNTATEAMSEVLSGSQYWSSRENYVVVTKGGSHIYSRSKNPIRCIRDFDPDDPIE